MQVIVIVEASKESKSDWMYINSLLKYKYDITGHKLSPIYLNGKGRYKNVYKKVEELKKIIMILQLLLCASMWTPYLMYILM